ncbi:MAG: serine kinase of the HPr protein, regulates carbohydrate metabolism [Candidatus Brocadiaceae bacterium]|nr:serine kinase of the HPr protein, regulates carbohydrate metabolism [Candidatus Brocadiaceae bacterium]MBM2834351.1 serine kinase of the HPr protein, regulates carbohydrate metabolism [Candidatus Brocadiaceae bacterium]
MYSYSIAGLTVHSDFPLPALPSEESSCDISVIEGAVPLSLPEHIIFDTWRNTWWQATLDSLLLSGENTPSMIAQRGKIVIDTRKNPLDSMAYSLLIGPFFCALMYYNGLLPVHGSAVNVDGKGVIFLGNSGSGKSTAAAFCRLLGYPIMSDDLCALNRQDNGFFLNPVFPSVKLHSESASTLDAFGLKSETHNYFPGYSSPVLSEPSDRPCKLHAICVLSQTDQYREECLLENKYAVNSIMEHIHSRRLGTVSGKANFILMNCLKLIEEVPVYRLPRAETLAGKRDSVETFIRNRILN